MTELLMDMGLMAWLSIVSAGMVGTILATMVVQIAKEFGELVETFWAWLWR